MEDANTINLEIGSFLLSEYITQSGSLYYELKYKPQHHPIMTYPFLDKIKAISFAEQKTKSDKRLFR